MEKKIGFLEILIFCTSILYTNGLEPKDICRFLKYRRLNVPNKPELFITNEAFNFRNGSIESLDGICHFAKNSSDSELIINPNRISKNYDIIIEYDPFEKAIYKFDDTRNIYKIDLRTKEVIFEYRLSSTSEFESMSLDWFTKNMYYTQNGQVHVFNLKTSPKTPKRLFTVNYGSGRVKVFPKEGYLIHAGLGHQITRFELDGTNPLLLYSTENKIYQITLDYAEHYVYWIEVDDNSPIIELQTKQIRYVSLDGKKNGTFKVKGGPNNDYDKHFLKVVEGYVYFVLRSCSDCEASLFRAQKSDGAFDPDFEISEGINAGFVNILIPGNQSQKNMENHPCMIGGCNNDLICVTAHDKNLTLTKKCVDNQDYRYSV